MFLPLGDAPNPKGFPLVTYAIIALNVAVFAFVTLPLGAQPANPSDPAYLEYLRALANALPPNVSLNDVARQLSAYDLFVFRHGYRSIAPSPWALVESMFLHSGFMHLFGNMLFLWIYGDNVEHRLGGVRYALWYLVTGAIATLAHGALGGATSIPLVGASGAISGVLGFYFLWFPHNSVRVWLFLFPLVMRVVELPARLVLGFYLVVDNLLPFLVTPATGGGVAYGAHIGGFLAGLLVAYVMNWRSVVAPPGDYSATASSESLPTRDAIVSALRDGRHADAANAYFALPADRARRILPPEDAMALADWLAQGGYAKAALTVYQRQIRDFPESAATASAHVGAGRLQLTVLGQPAAAYQHFVEALSLDPDPATEAAARRALAEIAGNQKFRVGVR
ncbi:MAG: rhomboid family intramembrane serine protease [Vicinamibacterales bacterium]